MHLNIHRIPQGTLFMFISVPTRMHILTTDTIIVKNLTVVQLP